MRIAFYAPLKPLNHINPSGDLSTGKGLYDFLCAQGHQVAVVSRLRARWIFRKPWLWPALIIERRRAISKTTSFRPDLWLTYHTYYKAPDMLGPHVCRRMQLPYAVFQGIYATKYQRDWKTWAGYRLNHKALCTAAHVFANKQVDWHNLKRLLPPERLSYIVPGLDPQQFQFDPQARAKLRRLWKVNDAPVVVSAAMFRSGVKTQSLMKVIQICGLLRQRIKNLHLVIAGEGREKNRLAKLAEKCMPGGVSFIGRIAREKMYRFYSAGDVFVFPGINESLGMVFLEAQSCGLPVVAFDNAGVPEAVQDGKTGFLAPFNDDDRFMAAIADLLLDKHLRRQMGQAAQLYVRARHDLHQNYSQMEQVLRLVAAQGRRV